MPVSNGDRCRIRVLVAEGHRAARVGAVLALEAAGFDVVEDCATAAGATAKARERRPDVCLVDADLPGGLPAVAAIAALRRAPRVIVLARSGTVDDVLAALDAGAAGYLLKSISGDRLAVAVGDVASGHIAISPPLLDDVVCVARAVRTARRDVDATGLTGRERDVLGLLAAGLTTKQAAQRLGLSATTVRRHVSSAAHKLGVHDRRAAIARLETVQRRERE